MMVSPALPAGASCQLQLPGASSQDEQICRLWAHAKPLTHASPPPTCHAPPPLQLSHCHRLFDVEGVLHSLESREAQEAAVEKLAPLRPVLDEVAAAAAAVRNGSAYRWVDLGALLGRISA